MYGLLKLILNNFHYYYHCCGRQPSGYGMFYSMKEQKYCSMLLWQFSRCVSWNVSMHAFWELPLWARGCLLFLSLTLFLVYLQMREDDLLRIQHIGDVIDILQTTAHHLYDPDELLTVNLLPSFGSIISYIIFVHVLVTQWGSQWLYIT